MNKYTYEGPVMSFNNILTIKWRGSTLAPTKKKAMSNLAYQYKTQNGLAISIPVNFQEKYLK